MNKSTWMRAAEVADALRVVPRLFMLGYAALVLDMHLWFLALNAPTTQQMAYANVVYGGAVILTGWYYKTGRKWEKEDG